MFFDKGLSIQRLKQSFLGNLWGWVNLFIVPKIVYLVDFVDCLGSL